MCASELMADVLATPPPSLQKPSQNHPLYSDGCLDRAAGMDISASFQIVSSRMRQKEVASKEVEGTHGRIRVFTGVEVVKRV